MRGEQHLDAGEFVDVIALSGDELDARRLAGELTDAKTLIGLLLAAALARRCSGSRGQPAPKVRGGVRPICGHERCST